MFDQGKADRAVRFIKNLKHTQGDWTGKPFNLLPWEEKIIRDLFGTVNEDGKRQYREAYISVPRKNGKTELAAAIAIYCLFADGEKGAEIYCAAADRDQATKVFSASKFMVEQNETLTNNSKILDSVKRITYQKRNSFFRALSSESHTKHGYNASTVIYDELHVAPNRELYDVLKTGMGARSQPLMISITTAGYDKESICWQIYDYAKKVQQGIVEDPTFYSSIFELDEGDDWKDETNWFKVNPGLGIYRDLSEMRQAFKQALEMPAFENTFKRLYLNLWTSQDIRLIPMDKWDACPHEIDFEKLKGRVCYGGLDLASTIDIAAFVLCFPPEDDEEYIFLSFFWIPANNMIERSRRDRVPYDVWAKNKLIHATPGDVIDYNFILQTIRQLSETYDVREIAFDRWGAAKIAQDLMDEGNQVFAMGQGFASMSAPTKEMIKLIYSKVLNHGGNKVLRWMADNVSAIEDPAGNLKPDKSKSREKIDGIVALIMALDRAIRNGSGKSILDEKGLQSISVERKQEEKTPEPEIEYTVENPILRCLRCQLILHDEDFCPSCGKKTFDEARI